MRVPADLLQQVTEALGAQGLTIRTILKGGKDVAQVERIPNWLLERGELCKHGNHWAEPCPRCKASFQT